MPKRRFLFRGFKPSICDQCNLELPFRFDPSSTLESAPVTELPLPLGVYARSRAEERLIAPHLRLGEPVEKHQRLFKLLGLPDRKRLKELRAEEEEGIAAEIISFGSHETDPFGWCDADWLHYFKEKHVDKENLPAAAIDLDLGHEGMSLSDFVKHPFAVLAGLDRAMVLALRLYSSSVHVTVNKYLRLGCSPERPHPYPSLVTNLVEAIMLLRKTGAYHTPGPIATATSDALPHVSLLAPAPPGPQTTVGLPSETPVIATAVAAVAVAPWMNQWQNHPQRPSVTSATTAGIPSETPASTTAEASGGGQDGAGKVRTAPSSS